MKHTTTTVDTEPRYTPGQVITLEGKDGPVTYRIQSVDPRSSTLTVKVGWWVRVLDWLKRTWRKVMR